MTFLRFVIVFVVFSLTSGRAAGQNDISAPTYRISHYCACAKCCGKWADGFFANGEKTSSCATPTIACNWLKFGTRVKIDGVIYVVRDRGAKSIFGTFANPKYAFDIYCASHVEARNRGIIYTKKVEVLKCQ